MDDSGRRGHHENLFRKIFRSDVTKSAFAIESLMIGILYRHSLSVNSLRNTFQLKWDRKLVIYVSCVSRDSRRHMCYTHTSCVLDNASFAEIGQYIKLASVG